MANDISKYMQFSAENAGFQHRSIRSLFDVPCIVLSWKTCDSKYRDGNPSGKFVQMHIEVDNIEYIVNTGSSIIMDQLNAVKSSKERNGESDMSFTCVVKRYGRGVKFYPVNWK